MGRRQAAAVSLQDWRTRAASSTESLSCPELPDGVLIPTPCLPSPSLQAAQEPEEDEQVGSSGRGLLKRADSPKAAPVGWR